MRRNSFVARPDHLCACRHPGQTLSTCQSDQLDAVVGRTLPGVDITRTIAVGEVLSP